MGPDVQTHSLIPAVYLHIPFCLTKCGYCSFYSVPYSKALIEDYYTHLLQEIELFKQAYNITPDTIYFGGGTPSLLTATQIQTIIEQIVTLSQDAVARVLPPQVEITLEANPVQITEAWLKAMSQTKVNRLSLGVQSMQNKNLQTLGRKHTAESMPERIRLCREYGFSNISLDLMYGLPDSNITELKADLEAYLKLEPEHISTYLLSIEDDAPYKHWKEKLPGDEAAEEQYNLICDVLGKAGYVHYELSNFAKAGFESRHNLHYWLGDSFLGLGAGASGFIEDIRYHRPDDIELWQETVEHKDILWLQDVETLAQEKADFIIMQLRLMRGLDMNQYKARFGTDFALDYPYVMEVFTASGHVEVENQYVRLTRKAWFVSNSILREFV